MKPMNKLVALILALLMLAGSTVAYAGTYVSDPISPNITNPSAQEQPEAEATPAPEAEATPAPEAEATPTPEASVEPALEEQPVEEAPEPEAVVTTESEDGRVNIRAAASLDAEIIGYLNRNDRVVMLGVEGDWTRIRANGVVGYIYSKYLQIAEPEPTIVPEETLAPEEAEQAPFESQYLRDEQGELILDEQGNPIPLAPIEEGAQYQRDEAGNLILDENGEPILLEVQEPTQDAERSDLSQAVLKTWMDAGEGTQFGDTVTVSYEIQNFFGWEYTVQWQRKDADGWSDVPGATGKTHSFTLTEENLNTEWRVRVDVVVPEAA